MNRFQKKLAQLKGENRLRSLNLPSGIDLTSNDYLGLRHHPVLREVAIKALQDGIDLGAGGSRLLRGHTEHHKNLEEFAATYFGAEKALYFATGYQANMALFSTLPVKGDLIIFDEYIHASARDGIQASLAKHVRVPHNDLEGFAEILEQAEGKYDQIWIAVESVYSMDGDFAPLKELHALAAKHGAILIVDEAHGTGVWGASGKGLSEGLAHEHMISLHTCGKALGVAGGLICAKDEIIDTLINRARAFIYSTAPPPLQALLVQKALEIVRDEPERREQLHKLIKAASEILPVKVQSQIIPVVLGEDAKALDAAESLQRAGFDIRAIRPPSVPENSARLRLILSTAVNEQVLCDIAQHLNQFQIRKAA